MKKLLSIALIPVIAVTLAVGCTPKAEPTTGTPEPAPAAGALKDGTYTAKGETDERGWTPEITVTVSGGKITEAKYDETTGMKKSADTEYHKAFKDAKNVDLVAAYTALQDSLVANQDVAKVEAVAGATASTTSFTTLATEALKDAKDGDKYKDGEYSAKGTEDERGWTPTVAISVKEGKIATVTYDEVSSKVFTNKSADAAYVDSFKSIKNVDLPAAYAALQASLVEKQDAATVDTFTGATASTDSFKALAAKALEQAK